MPQIDFGRAFAITEEGNSQGPQDSQPNSAPSVESPCEKISPAKSRRSSLGRSDWVNIIFAIIVLLGGLLCAFYFLNGAEIFRGTTDSPDSHPSLLHKNNVNLSSLAASPDLPRPQPSAKSSDRSGDPFSRVPDSLSLNSPNSRLGRLAFGMAQGSALPEGFRNPSRLLSQLDLSAPGSDELMQTFTRAITELGRIARFDAQRKADGIQSTVTRPPASAVQ